jgi:quercetin dioxygenase-like cupin family protein
VTLHRTPFTQGEDASPVELRELEGRALQTPAEVRELLLGDEAVLAEFRAPAGFHAGLHAHDHESLVYLLSGRILATVGDETRELGPGDAVLHLAGVAHSIEALVDTRWIEVKAPPRPTWPRPGGIAGA